jgi:hypothetical protein
LTPEQLVLADISCANLSLISRSVRLVYDSWTGSCLVVITMIVTIYVHLQPNVPANVLPIGIKPVLVLLLAAANIFYTIKQHKATSNPIKIMLQIYLNMHTPMPMLLAIDTVSVFWTSFFLVVLCTLLLWSGTYGQH